MPPFSGSQLTGYRTFIWFRRQNRTGLISGTQLNWELTRHNWSLIKKMVNDTWYFCERFVFVNKWLQFQVSISVVNWKLSNESISMHQRNSFGSYQLRMYTRSRPESAQLNSPFLYSISYYFISRGENTFLSGFKIADTSARIVFPIYILLQNQIAWFLSRFTLALFKQTSSIRYAIHILWK